MSQTSQTSAYFNLLTYGVGQVSRIRDVTGRRKGAKPSVYCTVAVPLDPKGVEYPRWSNFDVRVVGDDAIELINAFRDPVAAGQRPRIQFTIGDIYGHAYMRSMESGSNEVRASFKGRLVQAVKTDLSFESQTLRTHGIGYAKVVRVGDVDVLCIAALGGSKDDVQYTYFDASINPANAAAVSALEQVRRIKAADDSAKVLVAFELAKPFVSGFVFSQSPKREGELGTNNVGDLVRLSWIRVNGESVALANQADCEASDSTVEPTLMDVDLTDA